MSVEVVVRSYTCMHPMIRQMYVQSVQQISLQLFFAISDFYTDSHVLFLDVCKAPPEVTHGILVPLVSSP